MNKAKKYTKQILRYLGIRYSSETPLTYQERIKLREPSYHKKILYGQEGHDRIAASLDQGLPMMVSRLGGIELDCISFYLLHRSGKRLDYPRNIKHSMLNNAGFFPAETAFLDKFSYFFLDHLSNTDIMGVWFNDHESMICNDHCKSAELVDLGCLEAFRYKKPWSSRLRSKKVLVVHPFVESINKQYSEKRHMLFKDPDVLPDFELKTVKAVQSIAGSRVDFATWFDAYQYMCDEIGKVDFDIAIIGAGAYGLPLASFVKKLGKQAIHLGGVTQILFGVKGRRWEVEYATTTAKLFNKHWIRPLESEIPAGYKRVEKGCYW